MRLFRSSVWVTLAVLAMAGARPAGAEVARSLAELDARLEPGTEVEVVDRDGRVYRGDFARADGAGVLLTVFGASEGRRIPAAEVVTVSRKDDSLKNGMLIGGAVGLAGSALGEADEEYEVCDTGGCKVVVIALSTAVWAGIGALVDHLAKGKETLYRAPQERVSWSVRPVAVRGGGGVNVSVAF